MLEQILCNYTVLELLLYIIMVVTIIIKIVYWSRGYYRNHFVSTVIKNELNSLKCMLFMYHKLRSTETNNWKTLFSVIILKSKSLKWWQRLVSIEASLLGLQVASLLLCSCIIFSTSHWPWLSSSSSNRHQSH